MGVKFVPESDVLKKYKDGGVAVIDQIVCSHAKHFVGSAESTFTFRIQEEREIMGFAVENTFGMLCPDGKFDCEKGFHLEDRLSRRRKDERKARGTVIRH